MRVIQGKDVGESSPQTKEKLNVGHIQLSVLCLAPYACSMEFSGPKKALFSADQSIKCQDD